VCYEIAPSPKFSDFDLVRTVRYERSRSECWKNYEAYTPYMLNNFCEVVGQTRGVFRTSEIAPRLQNLEIAAEKSLRSRSIDHK